MLRDHLYSSLEEVFDILASGKQGSKLPDVTEQIEVMVIFSVHFDASEKKSPLSPSPESPHPSSLGLIKTSEARKRLDQIYKMTHEAGLGALLKEIEDAGELPLDRISNILMAVFRDHRLAEAYSLLYELNYKRFLILIYRKTKCYGHLIDPQDVLQDVFVAIYRYSKRFQEGRPHAFRNWCYSIIRNTIFKHLKKRGNHQAESEALLGYMEDKKAKSPLSDLVQREGIMGFQNLYMYCLILYLNVFNNCLTPRERRGLQLVEVYGKLYREASQIMGIKLDNFKMVICRARKKILKRMNQMLEENSCQIAASGRPRSECA